MRIQSENRQDSIKKLEFGMKNPGYFSILLLGERGVGKTFGIDALIDKISSENKSEIKKVLLNAFFAEESINFWEKQYKDSDNGFLIIDEVERLSKKNQELLFQSMVTDNGKYGFQEKKYQVRIIFTSTFDVSVFNKTEEYLSHKFFDRISQLVVKIPSFKDSSSNIEQDFIETWEKFKFEDKHTLPEGKIVEWLKLNADRKLNGNFRDLDKLCINWHNYRLMGYAEDEIYHKIIDDFSNYLKYPEHKTELHNEFQFSNELTHDEIMKSFRQKYKQWAKKEFGSLKEAGKVLNISHRTMERW